ncbi:hypothetical protein CKM354_001125600 [Cercospora kikuchii]|uniref:Zn(2)-C6 fungal-type domain-containing protein n=1 Tax=Cercospora kikuchii TaxID=84275 RepID=A0A9P3FHX1_9PEZI|nr:uncharacterized protein CKM354_001125600 [Cercospora kikuchii]GIZ48183.1 hypothetical protein CKM354_001125600 [Cercospora kikuchii]
MDQALHSWREWYGIDQGAYLELLSILTTFRAFPQGTSYQTESVETFLMESGPADVSSGQWATLQDHHDRQQQLSASVVQWQDSLLDTVADIYAINTVASQDTPHRELVSLDHAVMNQGTDSCQPPQTISLPSAQRRVNSAPSSTFLDCQPACIRCWKRKSKCTTQPGGICGGCSKSAVPAQLCIRERLTSNPIFTKWTDCNYRRKLAWEHLFRASESKKATLCHDRAGPTLSVICSQFLPNSSEQTRLFYKYQKGWTHIESTPYVLCEHPPQMVATYVSECVKFYLNHLTEASDWLMSVFEVAKRNIDDRSVQLALHLWAANRLLMKGWQISGPEHLGMERNNDTRCPLFGTIPAPRVLQNQLDHMLEEYIASIEQQVLKTLSKAMLSRRCEYAAIFAAALILLHVMERDIWRLQYWILNPKVVPKHAVPPFERNLTIV